jgi:hypothetical protein
MDHPEMLLELALHTMHHHKKTLLKLSVESWVVLKR